MGLAMSRSQDPAQQAVANPTRPPESSPARIPDTAPAWRGGRSRSGGRGLGADAAAVIFVLRMPAKAEATARPMERDTRTTIESRQIAFLFQGAKHHGAEMG